MKIAYLSAASIPSRGANSVQIMRMCSAMAQLGHDVELHAVRAEQNGVSDFEFYASEPNFRIIKHTRRQIRVLGAVDYAARMHRYFQRHARPDFFYAREIYSLAAVSRLGVPFCFEVHWRPRNPLQHRLESWLLAQPSCRQIVFISDALRQLYRRLIPSLPAERMAVAHDAADARSLVAPALRSDSNGRPRVGYVGSFFAGYGIELVPALAERLPGFDFTVIGGDPEGVQRFREQTRASSNLEFLGFVPPARLPELYAKLDILIAPYQATTPHIGWISPMKLFEYMAYGKPIVCADHPVLREVLTNDVNSLLVAPSDLDAWCRALERLRDPQLRLALAQRAFEQVREHHTWDRRARDILAPITLTA